jgi:hypothetical protein
MPDSRTRGFHRGAAALITAAVVAAGAAPVAADEYDPQEAGHPLRILAYAVHPIGVMLDLLIFRPAHWVGSHEPIALLFGHERYTH